MVFLLVGGIAALANTAVLAAQPELQASNDSRVVLAAIAGRIQSIKNLPGGQARLAIQRLRTTARERALKALNKSALVMSDLDDLRIDKDGGLFFVDTLTIDDSTKKELAASVPTGITRLSVEAAANVFALHSNPGSTNILHIDFDGDDIEQTRWNGPQTPIFRAAAFSQDDDFSKFSERERAAIYQIWYRVAEHYSPFDIDVTTQDPGSFGPTVSRVLITKNQDLDGRDMPFEEASSLAYVGAWGSDSDSATTPALVYYNRLSSRAIDIAAAASHGFGHNLGLGHLGYKVEKHYTNPSADQRSIAAIAGQLSRRIDDHSSEIDAATALQVSADGALVELSSDDDSANFVANNRGVIETAGDIDTFAFSSLGGRVELAVNRAWSHWNGQSSDRTHSGVGLTLLDSSGKNVTGDSADNSRRFISRALPAGRYYLQVNGVGNESEAESEPKLELELEPNYASLGQYFISGSILAPVVKTPPSPNPMRWSAAPRATSKTSIAMTAFTASDRSGVEYQFSCSAIGQQCKISKWQTSPDYLATGLQASTAYRFQVRARNSLSKVTKPSTEASATTATNRPPIAQADDAGSLLPGTNMRIQVLSNDRDPDGDSLTIASVEQAVHGAVSISGNVLIYQAGKQQQGRDRFEYMVVDSDGATAKATVSLMVLAANQPPVAVDDFVGVRDGLSIKINVLENDNDPEGGLLSLVSVSGASHGDVMVDGGSLVYTSDHDYSGLEEFSYTVKDERGATVTAQVLVNVNAANRSPVAADDFVTAGIEGIKIEMLANDNDADGDQITVIWLSLAENGSVSLDGSLVTYIPNPGFVGNDSFDYQIEDPAGGSDIATVTVTVLEEVAERSEVE
ncbi:MAG: tandem-95 repeat protein [Immundisolibacteraceae bacterium]|nr:tandem-95 repeat protein [Immundisolibacteraceae bacterium]